MGQYGNPLPDGWAWTTLGDVAFVNPRDREAAELPSDLLVTFVPMAAVDGDVGAITEPRQRPLADVRKGFTSFADGDVLFAKITPCMENGKAAIARNLINGRGFGSTEFHVLRPHADTLPEWLFYFVRREEFRREAKANFAGTAGQLRVPVSFVADHLLPLPPLAEQHRIVAAIEEHLTRLDAGVAALMRAGAKLRRYKAAVLKAACEGRLVPQDPNDEPAGVLLQRILAERRAKWEADELAKLRAKGKEPLGDAWKLKYEEPKGPDTTGLPGLPQGWCWAKVEQLNPADRACAYGVLQPGADLADGVPFLRIGDIDEGKIDIGGMKRIDPRIAAQYPRTKLRGGEVVITLVGTIGRTAVVPSALAGANTARAVGVIPLTRALDAHWIEIWFRNPEKVRDMTSKAHEVARKTLNLEDVRDAVVALPPLVEQQRIVAEVERRLSVVEEMETAIGANLARAERLRQSILKRAFAGRLVPQDPSDEPASALLARIRPSPPAPLPQKERGGRGRGGKRARAGATQGELEI